MRYRHHLIEIAIDNGVHIGYNGYRKGATGQTVSSLNYRKNDRSFVELSGHLSFIATIIANTIINISTMYAIDITSLL
jgi:hypothetical protein